MRQIQTFMTSAWYDPCWEDGKSGGFGGYAYYLASGASNYVHGTIIQVDGGYMVW